MTYELEFLRDALKEWEKLDKTLKAHRLRNLADCYKIKLRRQGYRLVYQVEDEQLIVLVVAVGKRERNMVYVCTHKWRNPD